jgi:Type I phosphodiesterase / nucleotide pyrophosphatase
LPEPPRLLLIGMDSFPPALLSEWCASGDLPNLAALLKEGRYGPVDSMASYFPGSVWATFSTAAPPSVHGIHHFMAWDPARMTYRRPAPDWCDFTPFWRRPAEGQPPLIAFDMPFTYAPATAASNLIELHGWGLHDELAPPSSSPAALLTEVRRRHGRSAMRPDVLGPRPSEVLRRELDGILASVERRIGIIEDLGRRYPWRLFLAPFAETHRAGHWYWTDRTTGQPLEGVKQVAVAIDRGIPRLRALLGPDDQFVLFALHGMGEMHDLDRFSEPLIEQLEPPTTRTSAHTFDPIRLLNRALPGGFRRAVSAALSTSLRDRLFGHYLAAGVDWSKTRIIAHPPDGCIYLRLNLVGRERDGIVPPAERDALLAATAAKLLAMRDLAGQPVFVEAARPSDLFPAGPRSELLPDLVLRTDHRIPDTLRMDDGSELQVPWRGWRDGDHRPEGFYIQVGPGFAPGSTGSTVTGEALAAYLCAAADLHFAT